VKKVLWAAVLCSLSLAITLQAQVHQQDPTAQQAARENKLQYVGNVSPDATTTCTYNFTSGTGNKFLKYCVTKNGNITQFQSPSGQEYIATAPAGEGYAFCDFDSSTPYYDYAGYGDSGNWQASKLVSSTATAVKIARTTTDGKYTLTQTITQNAGNAAAQVSMSLKNNAATTHHVGLLRFADIDASGNTSNSFDYTYRTAFGYNNGGYGMQLFYISGAVANGPSLNGAFSQDIPGGPNSCQIFLHTIGPFSGDGSVFLQYDMMVAAGATKTVQVGYRAY